jgi:glyoxylase-like metal-dependent hydrolase (beta-lactamase superfamily II)
MIPLEDNFSDIIGKAQRGLRLSDTELAEKSRVSSQKIRELRQGDFDELALLSVAGALDLSPRMLCELAKEEWHPQKIGEIRGLAQFTTHYHDMTVNAYLVWDPKGDKAVAFDTGADCRDMLKTAAKEKVAIDMVLLTHAHPDHVADLPRLREETGAAIYVSEREPVPPAEPIEEGKHFRVGTLDIEARLTWGHSPGGMTFVVSGLAHPVAIVGDSLFAGSMGGGGVSYEDALRNNLEKILTLPDETIICPGHGPMTTVGEEKAHNPFFAGKL